MRKCKHCERKMLDEEFPVAYRYRGKEYRRWECRPCLADLKRERMAERACINEK